MTRPGPWHALVRDTPGSGPHRDQSGTKPVSNPDQTGIKPRPNRVVVRLPFATFYYLFLPFTNPFYFPLLPFITFYYLLLFVINFYYLLLPFTTFYHLLLPLNTFLPLFTTFHHFFTTFYYLLLPFTTFYYLLPFSLPFATFYYLLHALVRDTPWPVTRTVSRARAWNLHSPKSQVNLGNLNAQTHLRPSRSFQNAK